MNFFRSDNMIIFHFHWSEEEERWIWNLIIINKLWFCWKERLFGAAAELTYSIFNILFLVLFVTNLQRDNISRLCIFHDRNVDLHIHPSKWSYRCGLCDLIATWVSTYILSEMQLEVLGINLNSLPTDSSWRAICRLDLSLLRNWHTLSQRAPQLVCWMPELKYLIPHNPSDWSA